MTSPFSVRTTPRYERVVRSLLKRHPDFMPLHQKAIEILQSDPYNRSRARNIKKFVGVPVGEGQWRLALGRIRCRYEKIPTRSLFPLASNCSLRKVMSMAVARPRGGWRGEGFAYIRGMASAAVVAASAMSQQISRGGSPWGVHGDPPSRTRWLWAEELFPYEGPGDSEGG